MAEGVETEAQKIFLIERGCEIMQGYFYNKPVCAKNLPRVIQAT